MEQMTARLKDWGYNEIAEDFLHGIRDKIVPAGQGVSMGHAPQHAAFFL
jgi:hypothetical protein